MQKEQKCQKFDPIWNKKMAKLQITFSPNSSTRRLKLSKYFLQMYIVGAI